MSVIQSRAAKPLMAWQGCLTALFLSVPLFQSRISSWLASRHLDPVLQASAHDAILRFVLFLCLGSLAYVIWAIRFERQTANETQGRVLTLCLMALGLGFAYIVLTRFLQFPISRDDAYIDYRHVQNLVEWHSLDYNPGLPVMGFTSHFHYLLLSFLSFVTGMRDLSVLSQCVNAVTQLIAYVFLFVILTRITGKPVCGLIGALVYALLPYDLKDSFGGKETIIVQFLILLSIWAVYRESYRTCAWAGCLLFLTRPEGVFYLAVCLVWTLWKRGINAWRFWVIPGATVAVWYCVLIAHFGTVLPHGGLAKKLIYYGYPSAFNQIITFFSSWIGLQPGMFNLLVIAAGWLVVVRKSAAFVVYSIAISLIAMFFMVSRVPLMFSWYLSWFSLLAIFFFAIVCDGCGEMWAQRRWRPYVVLAASVVLLLISTSVVSAYGSVRESVLPIFSWTRGDTRLLLYQKAAEYINARGFTGTVAVSEPGAFGYIYKGTVLDLGGLVSAEMVNFLPIPPRERWSGFNTAIPTKAIRTLQPEYVVFFDAFAHDSLLVDDWFKQNYVERENWPFKDWTVTCLLIYQKRSPADSIAARLSEVPRQSEARAVQPLSDDRVR
jgi:hypothetical protein